MSVTWSAAATPVTRQLSLWGTVTVGVVTWIVCSFIVDWLVMQVYPIPPGMWGTAGMREIIASRPDAAVALNIAGQLLALMGISFIAASRSGLQRAGVLITVVVIVLVIANAIGTANFRWLQAVGLPLAAASGLWAARRGARPVAVA